MERLVARQRVEEQQRKPAGRPPSCPDLKRLVPFTAP